MFRLRTFWNQVNAPPLQEAHHRPVRRGAAWGVVRRFFLKPFWGSIILMVILAATTGTVSRFFYAWTGRFVADDIVQVQLQARSVPAAAKLDPTRPGENKLFAVDEPHERTSLSTRLAQAPGRSVAEKTQLVILLGLALLAVLIIEHISSWILGRRHVYVGQKVQYHLRHRIYEKLQALPMSYHDDYAVGRQMTNLFSDVAGVENCVMMLIRSIPRDAVTMCIGASIMFAIDVPLAAIVMLALPMYGLCYSWFHTRLKTVHDNLRHRQGKLDAHLTNRITNFYLVKSFVREAGEAIDFLRRSRPIVRDALVASILGSCFMIACGIISGVCMVAVVWLGVLQVKRGEMTLGTMLLFYTSAGFMFAPVSGINNIVALLHRLRAVAGKVSRVLDQPIALAEPNRGLPLGAASPTISFENVTLRYKSSSQPALDDISFTLPAGRTLCVMGPSGSGKSTLARLACRIYDPTAGAVKLDGWDIRNFRLGHLRKITGYLDQEPVVFDGTIRENIRYGSEKSDYNSVVSAAQFAQIHDFIWQLPSRYQTPTCQRGLTLSGGQKQRVNLARVLLYDPKLLIMDDCTSALDAETEAKLVQGFDTVLKGRTVILVSHRISMALRCDYVMVLNQGKAMEFGPPEELIEQAGLFKEMLDEQMEIGK